MIRVYCYRLFPTKGQETSLQWTLDKLRELYNAALQERKEAYSKQKVTLSAYQQMAELPAIREFRPEFGSIHSHLLQDVVTRLDRAYRAFFRRVKAGEKPGFPRFKGRNRYNTFTFKQPDKNCGVKLLCGGKRVRLAGVGTVKVKLHRPIEGKIKQVSVTRKGDGHWYIAFICKDVAVKPLPETGQSVGLDVGISTFAALSDGALVANPRVQQTAQYHLAKAQRRVSRRKLGSKRRRKAVVLLAKQHKKVRRVRLDFHHKVALDLVRKFDLIAVEKLNILGLSKGILAKQVHDAAWGQFLTILASKAESANREFIAVDPKGTSQECSGCGAIVRKDLTVRVHDCPHCGLVENRDINAAKNVLRRGQRLRGGQADGLSCDPRSPYLAACGR